MASKRNSMMLPSDFSLEDFATVPLEQIQNTGQGDQAETGERQSLGEQDIRTDSRYYSLVSDKTSIRTFYTARSSFASSMRDSVASHRQVPGKPKTPWQMTLREKNLIMSGFDETDWSGRGQHAEFGPDEDSAIDDILHPGGILGHSATAIVERVRCKRILLARKKIRCNFRLKREDAIEEVACLQRLNHAHVVRCVGTYVQGRELSILLYPATSYNLETFLERYIDLGDATALLPAEQEEKSQIRRCLNLFFGCLTSTILFIHTQLIKHMDIKPTNILVETKRARWPRVYIADFGIARAYSHANDAETDSRTPFSKAFAAPEVVRQDTRGFPADIFSLGCVFLEIFSVAMQSKGTIDKLREENMLGDKSYQGNVETIKSCGLLQLLTCPNVATAECRCVRWPVHDSFSEVGPRDSLGQSLKMPCGVNWYPLKSTIRDMISYDPSQRPTAQELQKRLQVGTWCCSQGAVAFEAEVPMVPRIRV